ncbi:hypothetical protein BDQ12DRAFT_736014 [Crucibulum laeve]|uniref:Mid2 domain-containing protein n=1 Tax=Crucibulum laeve TaxID=68775 RepID=A0A5C3LZ42_9AGAR|nr:hypothetical protein BDQ12DRAFT_736014 [Crucibulum laeve]
MMTPLRIDDQDPSIVYSPGQWKKAGSVNEYEGTTMETLASGATSQLQFTGTSIAVFGTIPKRLYGIQGNPNSTYSLDGQFVYQFAPSREDDTQYNVTFYQSNTLPLGNHTLLVTSLGNELTFYLDYFQINGDPSTTGSLISTSLLSTPTTTLSPTPAAASQLTPSTNSTGISAVSSSNDTLIGPIVGGILGGFTLLAAVLACLVMYVRRRRRRKPDMSVDSMHQVIASKYSQNGNIYTNGEFYLTPIPPSIPPAYTAHDDMKPYANAPTGDVSRGYQWSEKV